MSIKRVLSSLNWSSIREFLMSLYHGEGAGRKPYDPASMLKAQLLKHLLRIPSDRRLTLLLKRNRKMAKACGFKRKTPSHGLFTHFRHRLGKDGYEKVFSTLLKQLLRCKAVKGEVVALIVQRLRRIARGTSRTRGEKAIPTLMLEGEEEASPSAIRCTRHAAQTLNCLWPSLSSLAT